MATKNKTMSYIRKLEIVIKNEMQKYNKLKIQRFSLNMKYLNKLQNKTNKDLNLIEDRIQEREDKLCGVCYDEEATCKLSCVHKLCKKCTLHVNRCPFCRIPYLRRMYMRINKNEIIDELLDRFERKHMNIQQLEIFGRTVRDMYLRGNGKIKDASATINDLLGIHLFYREKDNGSISYHMRTDVDILYELETNYESKSVNIIYDCINKLSKLLLVE